MPRCLLVDDDGDSREAYAEYLRGFGYDVEELGDSRGAMAAIATSRPDIVVIDLQMPHMDGFDLLQLDQDHAGPTAARRGHLRARPRSGPRTRRGRPLRRLPRQTGAAAGSAGNHPGVDSTADNLIRATGRARVPGCQQSARAIPLALGIALGGQIDDTRVMSTESSLRSRSARTHTATYVQADPAGVRPSWSSDARQPPPARSHDRRAQLLAAGPAIGSTISVTDAVRCYGLRRRGPGHAVAATCRSASTFRLGGAHDHDR